MNFLKRLFCDHDYEYVEPASFYPILMYLYKCSVCGKEKEYEFIYVPFDSALPPDKEVKNMKGD